MFRSSARTLRLWWEDFSADILGADLPPSIYAEDLLEAAGSDRTGAGDRDAAAWWAPDAEPTAWWADLDLSHRAPDALTSAARGHEASERVAHPPAWSDHPHRVALTSRRVRRDGAVPVSEGHCLSPLPQSGRRTLPASGREAGASPARALS